MRIIFLLTMSTVVELNGSFKVEMLAAPQAMALTIFKGSVRIIVVLSSSHSLFRSRFSTALSISS
jgi:hypothetical protein